MHVMYPVRSGLIH